MDIGGLTAVAPVTSGAAVQSYGTSSTATDASASAAASSFVSGSKTVPAMPADLVAQLKALLQSSPQTANTTVEYSVDSKSGVSAVIVRDALTGRIIRQMPSEDAVRLLQSAGTGALFDGSV